MTHVNRPDYETDVRCRCAPSHNITDHNEKGCTHPVTRFYWNRKTEEYDVVNVPCTCRVGVKA